MSNKRDHVDFQHRGLVITDDDGDVATVIKEADFLILEVKSGEGISSDHQAVHINYRDAKAMYKQLGMFISACDPR